jgi:tetratricopeptide (TPR) repeat protein
LAPLFALCSLALSSAAAENPADAIPRLEAAVARYPDDPDLSWALARELAAEGALDEAAERLAAHLERWPDRPPHGWLQLGVWRYALHDDAGAIGALGRALAREPDAAATHLYLGLAKRRLGRFDAAAQHFRRAAALDGELSGWALLLEAGARFGAGDDEGARRSLVRVRERNRESEEARYARLILEGVPPAVSKPRVRLDAYGGVAFDSNVILESGAGPPGSRSDQDDTFFGWGSSATWRTLGGERHDLELGARYDQTAHLDLQDYDLQRYGGFVAARFRFPAAFSLHLDGEFGYTQLDRAPYLLSGILRPSLLLRAGERAGVLRLYAAGERLVYEDEPLFSSLERTGWSYGGGLDHYLPLRSWPDAWLSLNVGYSRRDTEASADLLGFDGAYDHDQWGGRARAYIPLPWGVTADALFSFGGELYDNPNIIDALTDDGVGDPSPERRRDTIWRTGVILTRPVARFTDLQLIWSFTNRDSNVDYYSYERSIVGLYLRAYTP